jgi:hypothetical protein
VRRLIAAVAAAGLVACAQPGAPPGGPEEREPPVLVGVSPDSGAVGVSPKEIVFRFDEVVNERPQGAADLSRLVVISPTEGEPRVGWHRKSISVRARRGWRPNTAYTITVLPGIADLRGNARTEPITIVFSTGDRIPEGSISGRVIDWPNARAAARARVEAYVPPDTSWRFIAVADSAGRFTLAPLDTGRYVVIGFVDANGNSARDPREAYDSATVALGDTAHAVLWAFVHDSLPPRISQVAVRDSVTLEVTLDRPADPTRTFDTTSARLRAADSSDVPLAAVLRLADWQRVRDSVAQRRQDSVARAQPGARVPIPPRRQAAARPPVDSVLLSRPQPVSGLVVRTARALEPRAAYRLILRDVRSLLGISDTTARVFSVPARDTTAADTTARP